MTDWDTLYATPQFQARKGVLRVVRNWAEALPDVRPFSVVDIGCGNGRNAAWLLDLGYSVFACDPSRTAVALYAEALDDTGPGYKVPVRCDADDLPWLNETMDAAFCVGVLHYVPAVAPCLAEMIRVLKPQGQYLFNVRSRQDCRAYGDIPENERGIPLTFLAEAELHAALDEAGMNNCHVRLESFNGNRDWVVEGVK